MISRMPPMPSRRYGSGRRITPRRLRPSSGGRGGPAPPARLGPLGSGALARIWPRPRLLASSERCAA